MHILPYMFLQFSNKKMKYMKFTFWFTLGLNAFEIHSHFEKHYIKHIFIESIHLPTGNPKP